MPFETAFDKEIKYIDRVICQGGFSQDSSLSRSKCPELKDAAIFVNDTLPLCLASAKSVFGDAATPEVALAIYDRILARVELKSQETNCPGLKYENVSQELNLDDL
jgi:hypothetical protein